LLHTLVCVGFVRERETGLGDICVKEEGGVYCPVETTMRVIGGKWKPMLLFHLFSGPKRYSELLRLVPFLSDRMLTRSLRELEADSLVVREVFAEVPVRVQYGLTDEGETLLPILEAMSAWGQKKDGANRSSAQDVSE